jgi:molecular chaperone GrpE (heat shock protein)
VSPEVTRHLKQCFEQHRAQLEEAGQALLHRVTSMLEAQLGDLTRAKETGDISSQPDGDREGRAGSLDILKQTENAMFRAASTLENDLKDLARGAKSQILGRLLRDILQIRNDIHKRKVDNLDEVAEELERLLAVNGLFAIPAAPGHPFDPRRHRAIGNRPIDNPDEDGRIAEVRGIGLMRETDDQPFSYAEVIVFRYKSTS